MDNLFFRKVSETFEEIRDRVVLLMEDILHQLINMVKYPIICRALDV